MAHSLRCTLTTDCLRIAVLDGPDSTAVPLVETTVRIVSAQHITDAVARFLAGLFELLHGIDLTSSPEGWTRLQQAGRNAARTLAFLPATHLRESALATQAGAPLALELELSRKKLEELAAPTLDKALDIIERVLLQAGTDPIDLEDIFVSGTPEAVPLLATALQQRFAVLPTVEAVISGEHPAPTPPRQQAHPAPEPEPEPEPEPAPTWHPDSHPLLARTDGLLPLLHPDDWRALDVSATALQEALDSKDRGAATRAVDALENLLFLIEGIPGTDPANDGSEHGRTETH